MKKIRLIAALIFAVALLCVCAVGASAKWWEGNPYDDVKSDAWYYDAVRICRENGIFNGVSEDNFGTGVKLTRAQLVTALAGAAGYGKQAYDNAEPFADVKVGEWYSAPIAWAYDVGITAGTGDGSFSPNKTISREELVTMLRRYAETGGYPVDAGETSLDGFPDIEQTSSWAKDALIWAYEKGIISGAKNGDGVYLAPKATATREQAAQMMVRLLAAAPKYEINGNDLSLYRIVYSPNECKFAKDAAERLAGYIEQSLGLTLPVVTDDREPAEYEILVGRTNREDAGLVEVDRAAFEDDSVFIWSVQGNRLVISGVDTDPAMDTGDRSTHRMNGSVNAVIYFAEEILGMNFYMRDNIVCEPDPVIDLPDGYLHTFNVTYKWRHLDGDGYSVSNTGHYYSEWGCGLPHQVGNLMMGYWKTGYYLNTWDNPCYTDPDNIAALIENVGELLEKYPDLNLVGLIQNDSDTYCQCDRCREVYRETGSRGGALLKAINAVCEAYEDKYPNVRYATWAYNWSIKPPTNLELHKNIVIYFNTLAYCTAHYYGCPDCKHSNYAEKYITKWNDLTPNRIEVWDHSGVYINPLIPFPNLNYLLENARWLADHGAEGVFMNSICSEERSVWYHPDFNDIRSYIFDEVFRYPYMSRGEYDYKLNSILKARYGDGWKYLREYIDDLYELAQAKCHPFYSTAAGYYDYSSVNEKADEIDLLWDKAEAAATDEQKERIEHERISWLYLKQCAAYDTDYTDGSEQSRAEYAAENERLYQLMQRFNLNNSHILKGTVDYTASPSTW